MHADLPSTSQITLRACRLCASHPWACTDYAHSTPYYVCVGTCMPKLHHGICQPIYLVSPFSVAWLALQLVARPAQLGRCNMTSFQSATSMRLSYLVSPQTGHVSHTHCVSSMPINHILWSVVRCSTRVETTRLDPANLIVRQAMGSCKSRCLFSSALANGRATKVAGSIDYAHSVSDPRPDRATEPKPFVCLWPASLSAAICDPSAPSCQGPFRCVAKAFAWRRLVRYSSKHSSCLAPPRLSTKDELDGAMVGQTRSSPTPENH